MKKVLFAILIAALLVSPALAAPSGGIPAAHGVDGPTFGPLVMALATSVPGAVAEHILDSVLMAAGLPAAHGVDGKTFGGAVSGLATTDPAALAAHARGV
jgi:hypothetical protein